MRVRVNLEDSYVSGVLSGGVWSFEAKYALRFGRHEVI